MLNTSYMYLYGDSAHDNKELPINEQAALTIQM